MIVGLLVVGAGCMGQSAQKDRGVQTVSSSASTDVSGSSPNKLLASSTPSLAPTSSPAWNKVLPLLSAVIKPFAASEKMQVGRLFSPKIERLVDVTGDGVPEALVAIGDGGASDDFVMMLKLENGKPVAVPFSDEAMINQPRIFVEGGSVMHGNDIGFISGGIEYVGSWTRQDDGKISDCSAMAYVWNGSNGRMEKDATLSEEIKKEYCARQAGGVR